MKAERKSGILDVKRLWLEKGVKPSVGGAGEAGGGTGPAGEVRGRGAGGISRRVAGVRGKAEGCNGPLNANGIH